ncbi:MAG: DUF3793 family protein [Ruminococcus sp.]|nr:DUF3793 family protein [Ruminococcus sp.]
MKTFNKKQAGFMAMLRGSVCRQHIESLFLYHASPVLRKAKPAVLITVKSECVNLWRSREKAMCKASGLCLKELKIKDNSSLFLIYDRYEIELAIRNEKSLCILAPFGYELNGSVDEFLNCLSARLASNDFPHEIGLFLGYPPGDVKAYIENEGKNCTCCGYWKVYEDVEAAQQMWAKIDEAQIYAIDVLQNFPSIQIAANLLRAV